MKNIFTEIKEVEADIEREPRNPDYRYRLGKLYLEFNETGNLELEHEYIPMARDEFAYALSLDRGHIRAWCALAQTEHALWRMGEDDCIISAYRKIKSDIVQSEDRDDYNDDLRNEARNKAREEYIQNNPNRSIELAETIAVMIEDRSLICDELVDVAHIMCLLDRKEDYEKYMERAELADPANKRVLERKADKLLAAGHMKEAVKIYREIVGRNPEDYVLRYWYMVALGRADINDDGTEQGVIRRRLEKERFLII